MILAQDKTVSFIIDVEFVSSKGKKEIYDFVNISFFNRHSPLSSIINFKIKDFFNYCQLLEKTKSAKHLHVLGQKIPFINPKERSDEFYYFAGINYKDEGADLTCGLGYGFDQPKDAIKVNRAKKTNIHHSFAVIDSALNNAPRVDVRLSHDAFLKYRSACLRAESSLRKLLKKVKVVP